MVSKRAALKLYPKLLRDAGGEKSSEDEFLDLEGEHRSRVSPKNRESETIIRTLESL
jgi:hypothetical protein